ncbi:hypothetical protein LTR22_021705 [Elasticomyces elasticus]|nr:hypothetical protein LTR22_021705 [Elasticomyces elasticus]KAK4928123.1 hypothetical protein LTR49_005061 [Elasticomyces elasticus]
MTSRGSRLGRGNERYAISVSGIPAIDLEPLDAVVARCNDLFTFAPHLEPDDAMLANRNQMQKQVSEASEALERARTTLSRVTKTLHEATLAAAMRVPSLLSGDHWYEDTDLLSLWHEDLRQMLKVKPPRDTAHFHAYVKLVLIASVDDYSRRYRATPHYAIQFPAREPDFARRSVGLICNVLKMDGGKAAGFHLLIWGKIRLLRNYDNSPVDGIDANRYRPLFDRAIEALLKRQRYSGYASCVSVSEPFPDYYDVARARRDLYAEWHHTGCDEDEIREDDEDSPRIPGQCWHRRNEALMASLNDHAYREVKQNVFLATAHVLPPELVECVLDIALECEDVPVCPGLRDEGVAYLRAYDACRNIAT